jgi:hypothetical protein
VLAGLWHVLIIRPFVYGFFKSFETAHGPTNPPYPTGAGALHAHRADALPIGPAEYDAGLRFLPKISELVQFEITLLLLSIFSILLPSFLLIEALRVAPALRLRRPPNRAYGAARVGGTEGAAAG